LKQYLLVGLVGLASATTAIAAVRMGNTDRTTNQLNSVVIQTPTTSDHNLGPPCASQATLQDEINYANQTDARVIETAPSSLSRIIVLTPQSFDATNINAQAARRSNFTQNLAAVNTRGAPAIANKADPLAMISPTSLNHRRARERIHGASPMSGEQDFQSCTLLFAVNGRDSPTMLAVS